MECDDPTEPGESPFLDLHHWAVPPVWPDTAPPLVKEVKKRAIKDGARGYCVPKSPAKPRCKVGTRNWVRKDRQQ